MKTIFPKDILDWFLWHKYLGFEHFYIIDDGCEPSVAEILEPYGDEITYFDIENKNKLRSHREIIKEMFLRFKKESHWLAFMDEDEYLMPLSQKSIGQFLETIEDKNAVYLQWRTFGPEGRAHPLVDDEIIMDEYRTYSYVCQGKMIVNTNLVESVVDKKGYDQHRLVRDGVVDCYGKDISPEYLDNFYNQHCGRREIDVRPDMPFVINHYAYRSTDHMMYRLFDRGCIQRKDNHKFLTERLIKDLTRLTSPKYQYLDNNFMRTFLFKDHKKLRDGYKSFYKKEMEL
jgi:hypothetical protein